MNAQKLVTGLQRALVAILAFVLLVNVYLALRQTFWKVDLPSVFGVKQVVVLTGSMSPAILPGDLLLIRQYPEYLVGDVVTYRSGGSLVTHRVIGVDGGTCTTQGDANNTTDAPVSFEQIEGKVVLRIPKLGRLIFFMKTPLGLLILLVLGVVIIEVPLLFEKKG